MTSPQADLFGGPPLEPAGLRYVGAMVDEAERDRLTDAFAVLPFAPFAFHGWLGARRVVSFGWRYDFSRARLDEAAPLPAFLEPLRDRAAAFAGVPAAAIVQPWSPSTRPEPASAGIGTVRNTTRSSASPSARPAACASGGGRRMGGSAAISISRQARPTSSTARPGPTGNTASRR